MKYLLHLIFLFSFLAVPVFAQVVNQDVIYELSIDEFYVSIDKSSQNLYFSEKPKRYIAEIENNSSVPVVPQGIFTIVNLFGNKVQEIKFNPENSLLNPEETFVYTKHIDENELSFGRYTAKLEINYSENEYQSATFVFWVLPWWIIISVLVVLIAIGFFFVRFRKKYHRRIIDRQS